MLNTNKSLPLTVAIKRLIKEERDGVTSVTVHAMVQIIIPTVDKFKIIPIMLLHFIFVHNFSL